MEILVLSQNEIKKVLEISKVIAEVENVYRLKAQGETVVWPLVDYHFEEEQARMDIRSGYVLGRHIHGMKMLNNFPKNVEQNLPPFNGLLMIYDSKTGLPLGLLDATYITGIRTGAAGAIGANLLARQDAKKLLVVGAGKQAIFQIACLLSLRSNIEQVVINDPINSNNAHDLVKDIALRLQEDFGLNNISNVSFEAADHLESAVQQSDIIITITPTLKPLIKKEWVKPGTHFSCIGADMVGKEEIDPAIFTNALVYCDDVTQCLRVGEVELPVKNGYLKAEDIKGEIGDVLENKILGRQNETETTIFDATGLALLDLVVGKLALDCTKKAGLGCNVKI